jgi:methyl-accepting chemotaxis protein
MMLKRLGLEQLIALGFGLVLLVATISGAVSIGGDLQAEQRSEAGAIEAQRGLLAEQLAMLQQREQATSRAFFLQPAEHGDARCTEAAQKFASILEQLSFDQSDSAAQSQLADVKTTWESGEAELRKMFALGRQGKNNEMLAELPASVVQSKKIQTAVTSYVSYMEHLTQQREEERWHVAQRALWLSALFIGMSFVIAIACAMVTLRIVSQRVRCAQLALEAIARKDLSQEDIDVHSHDTLGQTLVSVNRTKHALGRMIGDVGQIGARVSAAATELAATARNSAQGADEQRAQTEQVSSALTEMAASVAEVAKHTSIASESAAKASASVLQGDEAVSAATAKMTEISEQSAVVAQSIEGLAKHTEEIGRVAKLIRDIAAQTNLLALNAAIEAARAGEHGRGFSVVAVEVRRLAEQTGGATGEIDSMIVSVRQHAKNALEKAQVEHDSIAQGVALTETTRESFTYIRESVSTVDAMMGQIAVAAQQQAATTEELKRNLDAILQIASQSATAAHESSAASTGLSKLSEQMHSQIAQFQLPARGTDFSPQASDRFSSGWAPSFVAGD